MRAIRGQRYRLALHQVQQASRRGHDDVHALFEGAYLAFDGRAAVDGQHPQAVDILGIVVEVARYLQAEFARGAEDERLWLASVHIGLLQQRQSIGGGLSRAGLRQRHYVIVFSQQIRNHLLVPAWAARSPFLRWRGVSPATHRALQMSSFSLCITMFPGAKVGILGGITTCRGKEWLIFPRLPAESSASPSVRPFAAPRLSSGIHPRCRRCVLFRPSRRSGSFRGRRTG